MLPLGPPPATPPPKFSAPAVVTRTASRDAGPPALALDEQGHRLIAYQRNGRIVVRGRPISGRYAYEPAVALAPDGSAAVMWSRDVGRGRRLLELSVAPPGGRFGRPRRLVDVHANITDWQVFATGGRFVTIWWQGVPGHDHAIRYAVGSGAVTTLAQVDGNAGVDAAMGPAGEIVAGWLTPFTSGKNANAATASLPAGADTFGPAQELPGDPEGGTGPPEVFAGPGGTALTYVPYGSPWKLQVVAPGGVPHAAASVENTEADTVRVDGPALALPAEGGTVAAWAVTRVANQESEEPIAGRVDAAVQQPDGSFSAPVHLTRRHEFPTWSPSTGATRTAAVVLWPTGRFDRQRLRYVVRAGGAWFPAATLGTGANRGVTVAAAGDQLAAAWLSGRTIKIAELR